MAFTRWISSGARLILLCVATLSLVAGSAFSYNPQFRIEKTHNSLLGTTEYISIFLDFDPTDTAAVDQISGFDLLVAYDTSFITFLSAQAGSLLLGCGWEAFTWGTGSNIDCGGVPCPPGIVRLAAIADIENGAPHPLCLADTSSEVAVLRFQVTDDRDRNCNFAPIRFIWYSCDDNTASPGVSSDSVLLSESVWDDNCWYGCGDIAADAPLPSYLGAHSACPTETPAALTAVRAIDFETVGGVDIVCADSIDSRGDFNLNGISYEIADCVYFANYFWFGPSVLFEDSAMRAVQIAASDVNANNLPLELDDLVYTTRVVVGDALPFPRPVMAPSDTAVIVQDGAAGTVTITHPDGLRGVWLRFSDSVATSQLLTGGGSPWSYSSVPEHVLTPLFVHLFASFMPPTAGGLLLMAFTGPGRLFDAQASYDGLVRVPVRIEHVNMPPCCQARGDLDYSGAVNISDVTFLVRFLFQYGPPSNCFEHADVNADSSLTISDLTLLVDFLFGAAAVPPCE